MEQIERTITKKIYVAEDGTEFEEKWDCITYENNCFYESIHALGSNGKRVFDYCELMIFSIDSMDQIIKLKDEAFEVEATSELAKVTGKGVYAWNHGEKAFCKYPEEF